MISLKQSIPNDFPIEKMTVWAVPEQGDGYGIHSIAISPTGKRFASITTAFGVSSPSSAIDLWDCSSGHRIRLEDFPAGLRASALTFTIDEKRLVVAQENGGAWIYALPPTGASHIKDIPPVGGSWKIGGLCYGGIGLVGGNHPILVGFDGGVVSTLELETGRLYKLPALGASIEIWGINGVAAPYPGRIVCLALECRSDDYEDQKDFWVDITPQSWAKELALEGEVADELNSFDALVAWDLDREAVIGFVKDHNRSFAPVAAPVTGGFCVVTAGTHLEIRDMPSLRVLQELRVPRESLQPFHFRPIAVSPCGSLVAARYYGAGHDDLVYLWRSDGTFLGKVDLHHLQFISTIALIEGASPRLLVGSDHGTIYMWNLSI